MTTLDPLEQFPELKRVQEHFYRAGAGTKNSHTIITHDSPFEGDNTHYVYAIETYSDEVSFDQLKEAESEDNVASLRLNAGGGGYPPGVIITGKFTKIKPIDGKVVAGYIIKK